MKIKIKNAPVRSPHPALPRPGQRRAQHPRTLPHTKRVEHDPVPEARAGKRADGLASHPEVGAEEELEEGTEEREGCACGDGGGGVCMGGGGEEGRMGVGGWSGGGEGGDRVPGGDGGGCGCSVEVRGGGARFEEGKELVREGVFVVVASPCCTRRP